MTRDPRPLDEETRAAIVHEVRRVNTDDAITMRMRIAALEGEIAALRDRVRIAEERAIAAEARITTLEIVTTPR